MIEDGAENIGFRRFLQVFGAGAGMCAALASLVVHPPLVVALVGLAPLVVVPLGLSLALTDLPARLGWPIAIGVALASTLQVFGWSSPVGSPLAIVSALPWALAAASVGLAGLYRLRRRGLGPLDELAIDVGLLLLPVGGIWFFASRAGFSLLGFHEPIVLLTAAHFHYAGFAAPVIIGLTGRVLFDADASPTFAYRVGALTVCAGVPLTAAGIAIGRALEAPAAVVLAIGMLAASLQIAVVAARRVFRRSRLAAALLVISGLTLVGTMTLAASFALTGSAGRDGQGDPLVSISRMIQLHGAPNAVLFVLAGLTALSLLNPAPRRHESPSSVGSSR
jgi:hypothetical protein